MILVWPDTVEFTNVTTYPELLARVEENDRARFDREVHSSLRTGEPISETVTVALNSGSTVITFTGTMGPRSDRGLIAHGLVQTLPSP